MCVQVQGHGLILQKNIMGLLHIHNYGDIGTRPGNVILEIMELFARTFADRTTVLYGYKTRRLKSTEIYNVCF